ncbi:MAG: Fe-S cluster assembly protein SufD [Pseudomonadota bacterium]|mgnify:FL=1|jgi:Fe-S cluster assembly protein SufD
MTAPLTARIAEEFRAAASRLPAGVVPPQRREELLAVLTREGLPTSRDENWKYANLRALERMRFAPVAPRTEPSLLAADLPAPIQGYARYTFVDGVFAPALSCPLESSSGVTLSVASRSREASERLAAASALPAPADARFAALNEAFALDVARIRARTGAQCPACMELLFVSTGDAESGAAYPRLELDVEPDARLGLIERHVSLGAESSFSAPAVDIVLGRNAAVDHYRVQEMGPKALWIDTLTAGIAHGAAYRLYMVSLGAASARSTIQVRLTGELAEVGLHAVCVADRHQVHDTFALVEHAAPRAKTEQTFRGIAGGRARAAFNGKVIVREGAHGTDSRQSLRGLLAGPEAEIDVRPQLEIYTDDVRCSHGATAGKLDDDMLFYLLSRGLERDTAQRLLKWAFLEDVVAKIAVPELRRQIERSLAGQMNETTALKELL